MSFTKGNDRSDYARVYDRLRKRSYRSRVAAWLGHTSYQEWEEHACYVEGVRDALAAMEAIEDEHEFKATLYTMHPSFGAAYGGNL